MTTPLLLDTHCWIWFQGGFESKFERRAFREIERACARGQCWVSIISVWEIGMLASKDRIRIGMPVEQWVRQALETPGISLVGLPVEAALEASTLPGSFHADPADRLLVATARHYGATLATADEAIQQYSRSKYCTVLSC